jgi:glycosyltransferase involved in cell wall biosynthesis
MASLGHCGIEVSLVDIGTSYAPWALLGKLRELRRQVRRRKPDLVHAQYGTIVAFLSVLSGAPTVISFCGSDLLKGASVSWPRMWLGFLLSNFAALRARAIICKSEELRRALWWSRQKAVVIPSGVDLSVFSPGSRSAARGMLGWSLEPLVVLFNPGDDPRNKGLEVARAAVEVARASIHGAVLHVLDRVEPARMPQYYRAADALLLASRQEGSPNVVKEALACNLPVVSTPVRGVEPSEIAPREPQALGEALVRVLLQRARCNGRQAVAGLSLDHVAAEIIAVYAAALDG